MDRKTTARWALVALSLALLFAPQAMAGKSELIFQIEDPRGDDHGDGRLQYPARTEFAEGDFDLLTFAARRVKGGTQFEAVFANPVRRAERGAIDDLGTSMTEVARNGFYTFNVDVYIDTDRVEGSGGLGTLPGRKAEIRADHAWDRAVILTPMPTEAAKALERMMLKSLTRDLRTGNYDEDVTGALLLKRRIPADLDRRVFFPTRVRVRGQKICFFVPDAFLGGPAKSDWSYVVVVSGTDLVQSFDISASFGLAESREDELMILPISPGRWKNRFGGGRELEELQPPLVDILVPEGESQERILGSFSTARNRPVELLGVVPIEHLRSQRRAPAAEPASGDGKPPERAKKRSVAALR